MRTTSINQKTICWIWLISSTLLFNSPSTAQVQNLRRVVTYGSDHEYPPFEYLTDDGKAEGFNVDLIRAIGEVMGWEVNIQLGRWTDIRKELEVEGTVHISDMFYSDVRDTIVDYADPFSIVHDEVFVRAADNQTFRTVEDLKERQVLVQRGSFTHENLLREGVTNLRPVVTEPEALRRLAAGEGDAAVVSQIVGRHALQQLHLTNLTTIGSPLFSRGYSFVVKEGNQDLLDEINRGLAITKATGRYNQIYEKWFGELGHEHTIWERGLRDVGWILGGLIFLIAIVFAWSTILRRQVRERTIQLENELEEHQRTGEALRKSEEQFRTLVEQASDGIFLLNPALNIVTANKQWCEMLTLPREHVVSRNIRELMVSANVDGVEIEIGSVAPGEVVVREGRICGEAGLKDVEMSARGLPGGFILAIVRDISEQKRQQRLLSEQNQRLNILRDIERATAETRLPATVADIALKSIASVVPLMRASVLLLDFDAKVGTILAVYGEQPTGIPAGSSYPISSLLDDAARENLSGGPTVVRDIREVGKERSITMREMIEAGFRSFVSFPLISGGNLIGLLNAGFSEPGGMSDEHMEIMRDIANALSVNIRQAQLDQQLREHAQHLELIVAERTAQLQTRVEEVEALNKGMVNLLEDFQSAKDEAEQYAQRLAAANKELEAFSYSVSHDLRAPLRSIDGFSRALLEDFPADISEQAKEYLHRITGAAVRMGHLIDALLDLSRVSRAELKKDVVDLADIVRQVVGILKDHEPDRDVTVAFPDHLPAYGDRRLMLIVMDNLLGNAWKFTRKRESPLVEVGSIMKNGSEAYFVRDNGAGFEMEYSERLFGVFQRLHLQTEFEGTGIGLATVQRIIRRHGGDVWAEGKTGVGATIYFTLPSAP